MIISFDIDNTLIPYSNEFEVEDSTLLSKILKAEPIRKGTIELFKELVNQGHTIWIYTTSFRSEFNLKKTFKAYGLSPSRIINEKTNQRMLKKHQCSASKNAKLFGIDVHVDDLEGVGMEGEKYGFKTIILATDDESWTQKVLKEVKAIELNLDWHFKELITTLIALKSNAKRQLEIYGFGNIEEELVNDFNNYYSINRKNLLELGYISLAEDQQLEKLNQFIILKCNDSDEQFWEGLETHQDWEIIRGLAAKVLISMKKQYWKVKEEHITKFDEAGKLIMQQTITKLVSK